MFNLSTSFFLAFLPEVVLSVSSLLAILCVAFKKDFNLRAVFLGVCVLYTGIFIFGSNLLMQETSLGLLKKDTFSIVFSVLVLLTSGLAVCSNGNKKHPEESILICLSLVGFLVMVSATHFMTVYLGIELSTLPIYAWIALRKDKSYPLEAAVKYFILGALASGLLLLGFALIYAASGELSFLAIKEVPHLNAHPFFILGVCFFLSGVFFKLGAAPFHVWVPDVYQGATLRQVSYLSVAGKIAALAVIIKLLFGVMLSLEFLWSPLVMLAAVASLSIGAFSALWQTNLKRLLAFSGITHMGYILIGVSCGVNSFSALMTYIFAYALTMSLLFVLLFSFKHKKSGEEVEEIASLIGVGKHFPYQAALLSICLVSLAGIPPLAIFWGKFAVLLNAVKSGYYVLAFFAVLNTVVSGYYYLKIICLMYFKESDEVLICEKKNMLWSLILGTAVVFYAGYQFCFSALFDQARSALAL